MSGVFGGLLDSLLSLLFPPRCEVCGMLQEPVVCAGCRAQFERITEPHCRQCGLPFDPGAKSATHCPECRDDPPAFDAARAAGLYGGVLRRAIHLFKYDGVRAMAGALGEFTLETVQLPFPIDCLCPVPLHPRREAMRGFNQSSLLAEVLGEGWSIPVEAAMLSRVQNTPPQMSLPAEERRRNIRGAFTATGNPAGRAVGLVDDVFTTGSTLRECSQMLKRAGAERVLVITVARTTVSNVIL
ncbi:MAG: double zinc ribbon domain-containing protein [Armatimonadota bacterium]